jgi:hypothetical protein
MNAPAAASLRRRRLAAGSFDLTKLRLDYLFIRALADLDHAFIVTFARFRNSKNVLARGDICQNDAT